MSFYTIKVINKNGVLSVSVYKIKQCSVSARKKYDITKLVSNIITDVRYNYFVNNKYKYIIKSGHTQRHIKKLYEDWLQELLAAADTYFKHTQEN